MNTPLWQLKKPIGAVVFDCDGTLSRIEGIDELAAKKNVGEVVRKMTEEAMGKTGINPDLYRERIALVKPTRDDLISLADLYYENREPHVEEVIKIFQRLQKQIYIVSAGLNPAVTLFGEKLGIPASHVFAVDVIFDEKWCYQDYNHASPMTRSTGKREVLSNIQSQSSGVLFTGDGLNDLAAADLATRFVGYGGSYYRENIAASCEFYIATPSMASLLPLALMQSEIIHLSPEEKTIYLAGLDDILAERVQMR